ncbi:MAG: adenosine deaminase [Bacteriovoracia bacterium]
MIKTELHRHFEGALNPKTLVTLCTDFKDENEVHSKFILKKPMSSLSEVLARFDIFQKCFQSSDTFRKIAFDVTTDAMNEGLNSFELRYSPSFSNEKFNLDWEKTHEAIKLGIKDATKNRNDVKVDLLCTVSSDYGVEMANRSIDFAISKKQDFAGVDLAGNEVGFPRKSFQEAFKKAAKNNMNITVHAGEAGGPENVWEAIDVLGATRIGHGIRSIEDKDLIKRLAKDKIHLEVCPLSNYITASVKTLSDHPLPKLLDAGVSVSLNTDDPGIFGNSIAAEIEACKKYFGYSEKEFEILDRYASEARFVI